jgi:cytochrome bd-type quinol oxidase subunit 2
LILAAFGFFVILRNLVLPVFLSGFSSQMPKELALEMLKLMANVSLCLIAADLTLVGLATYVMQKKADTTAPERRRLREVGQAASVTLVFLALSFLTVLASMSYLGEYATRRDFVFPLLFMVCGVVGILYLLYLNTAEQDT